MDSKSLPYGMVVVPSGSFPTSTYHLTLVLFFIFVVELKYTNNEKLLPGICCWPK